VVAANDAGPSRAGVPLTNLGAELFDGADATKGALVTYLDAVRDRLLPVLHDRPLSVVRVHRGKEAFMQKNLPKAAPEWIRTVGLWAEASRRQVSYALCDDRRTLVWFANQRAVEYHPALARASHPEHVTHLVLDLDPPEGTEFAAVVDVAAAVRGVLEAHRLTAAVKTSGAKGVHVFVPVTATTPAEDVAAAARALADDVARAAPAIATTAFVKDQREGKTFVDATRVGGATVVAAYSPRIRPGTPVSFPVTWDELTEISPSDVTVHTAIERLGDADPWADAMPDDQALPADLVAAGHEIPAPRVHAMHEGRRRRRAEGAEGAG
jgi:bifunctional non-homologous end joining protein LigD